MGVKVCGCVSGRVVNYGVYMSIMTVQILLPCVDQIWSKVCTNTNCNDTAVMTSLSSMCMVRGRCFPCTLV